MNLIFKQICLSYFYILLLFIKIDRVQSKIINISNNSTYFETIEDIINSNQNDKELIVNFVDEYYDMINANKKKTAIEINVYTNITIVGNKKGTIFDYSSVTVNRWSFFYGDKGGTVKFENIIFNSYYARTTYIPLVTAANYYNNNLYMLFNNCTFQNNSYYIIEFEVSCTSYPKHLDPSFIFTNCNF